MLIGVHICPADSTVGYVDNDPTFTNRVRLGVAPPLELPLPRYDSRFHDFFLLTQACDAKGLSFTPS
jgi:hypothetical protein